MHAIALLCNVLQININNIVMLINTEYIYKIFKNKYIKKQEL
jgi:hypothetical protein